MATSVRLCGLQTPMECGWLRAYSFTAEVARASRVALAQHRVDRAALDPVVAGADLALLVGRRIVGVVRQGVAEGLQLGDRRLELRHGLGDVGQLDDVGLGSRRQVAQLGEGVADPLLLGEVLAEDGQDATGRRDVAGLDLDPGQDANACTTGRREYVASIGASSVSV